MEMLCIYNRAVKVNCTLIHGYQIMVIMASGITYYLNSVNTVVETGAKQYTEAGRVNLNVGLINILFLALVWSPHKS